MGEVALVTGGAVRIGKAISLRLAQEDFALAIHYNKSHAQAIDLIDGITRAGGVAKHFRADLDDAVASAALIPEVQQTLGKVTCLVNNASLFEDDRLGKLSQPRWDAHFSVNLRSPVVLSQAFAAQLPDNVKGNIINIIDQRVLRPNPQFFSYTLSKSALWTATQTMAQALAPHIRVNAIAPGPVLRSIHQTGDDFAHECGATLLGHGTTPEEIAEAVIFILRSPAMTGQLLALDGGQHLLWQTADIRRP